MPMEIHEDKIIMRAGKYSLPKPWVGLTDEEIKMWRPRFKFSAALIKEVEAKLKEKNQ